MIGGMTGVAPLPFFVLFRALLTFFGLFCILLVTGALMTITNIYNLPQPLMNLFGKEKYTKGDARLSVTELIGSPRVSILREANAHNVTEDITDRFWALMGTNIHRILEQGGDAEHIPEERLFVNIDGWNVSGGIDLQKIEGGKISIIDWKFVSVLSVMKPKIEWEQQLNCYAWLVREVKGVDVEALQICAILRDWSKSNSKYKENYPVAPVVVLDIPRWSHKKATDYIHSRLAAHKDARRASSWDEPIPDCTPDEMWLRDSQYAVYKVGGKRAFRVFPDEDGATGFVEGNPDKKMRIEKRPGTRVRCENNYCGVAEFCSQYQSYKATRDKSPDGEPAGAALESSSDGIDVPADDEVPESKMLVVL